MPSHCILDPWPFPIICQYSWIRCSGPWKYTSRTPAYEVNPTLRPGCHYLSIFPAAISANDRYMVSGRLLWSVGSVVTHSSTSLSYYIESCVWSFARTGYFFWQGAPLQFKVCAIFQLSVDVGVSIHPFSPSFSETWPVYNAAILVQRVIYGNSPPLSVITDEVDELEEALALADEN